MSFSYHPTQEPCIGSALPSNSFVNRLKKITERLYMDQPIYPDVDTIFSFCLEYVNAITVFMLQGFPKDYEPLPDFVSFIDILIYYLDQYDSKPEIDKDVFLQCLYITTKGLNADIVFKDELSLLNVLKLIADSNAKAVQQDFKSTLFRAILKSPQNKKVILTNTFFLLTIKRFFNHVQYAKFIEDNLQQITSLFVPDSIDLDTSYVCSFFFNMLSNNSIPNENAYTAIKFLTSYLKMNTLHAKKAINEIFPTLNGFLLILNLLIQANPQKIKLVFYDLCTLTKKAEESTINFIMTEIANSNQKLTVIVQLYSTISMLITQRGFTSHDIEFITDPTVFMRPHQSMDEEMKTCTCYLFNRFCALGYKYVKLCLSPLLDNFLDSISDEHCEWISEGLDLAGRGLISPTDLKNGNLLELFIVLQSPDFIAHVLEIFTKLTPCLASAYGAENDPEKKFIIITQILHSQQYFKDQNKFLNSFSMFIIEDKEKHIVLTRLMEMCFKSMTDEIMLAISYVFMQDEHTCLVFLDKCNGLQVLDDIINSDEITEENKSLFLESLTTGDTAMIISDWILSLSPNHNLFKIEPRNLWNIIFFDDGKTLCIRVPSLIPFVPLPPDVALSPADIYLIYTKALKDFTTKEYTIELSQIFAAITNRYISYSDYKKLIYSKKKLTPMCNENLDHFPVFELQPFKKESYIHIMRYAKAISFWVKLETYTDQAVTVLTANNLEISLQNDNYTVKFHGTIYGIVKVESTHWVLVHVTLVNELLRCVINVCIGNKNVEIVLPDPIEHFSAFTLGVVDETTKTRFYIGPAIRLFYKQVQDRRRIESLGVSSMKMTTEIMLITPNWGEDEMFGKGCFKVPYKSFASFLQEKERLIEFYNIILDMDDTILISDYIKCLISCHQINDCGGETFWPMIKLLFKRKHEYLKDTSTLDLITTLYYNSCIDYIGNDIEMWELYPDKMCQISPYNDTLRVYLATLCFSRMLQKLEHTSLLISLNDVGNYNAVYNMFCISGESIQMQILNHIIMGNRVNFDSKLLSVFQFNRMIMIMLTSTMTVSRRILDLICLINSNEKDYVKPTISFSCAVMRSIESDSLQNTLLSLITGTFEVEVLLNAIQVNRPHIIPALLFILILTISADFAMCGDENRIDEAVKLFENHLSMLIDLFTSICVGYRTNLLGTPEILDLICFVFPWIFDLKTLKENEETKVDGIVDQSKLKHMLFDSWNLPSYLESEVKDPVEIKSNFETQNHLILNSVLSLIKKCCPSYDTEILPSGISPLVDKVSQFLFDLITSFTEKKMFFIAARCLTFVDLRPSPQICLIMLNKFFRSYDITNCEIFFDLAARVHFRPSIKEIKPISVEIARILVSKELENVSKNQSAIYAIRMIIYNILDVLSLEESCNLISDIINIKKFSDQVFSDPKFTLLILERLCQFVGTQNELLCQTLSKFTLFVSTLKISDGYIENLPTLLQGLSIADSPNFKDWLSGNKDVYMVGMEKMKRFFGEFDDSWQKNFKNSDYLLEFRDTLNELYNGMNLHVQSVNKFPAILKAITDIYKDDSLRKIEEDEMYLFWKINSIELSKVERNCYMMGEHTWPGECPLIQTPSPIKLPKFDVGTSRPELYTHQLPQTVCFTTGNNIKLYNEKYTVFATLQSYSKDNAYLPIRCSASMSNSTKSMYFSFVRKFSQTPQIYNCKFLKYSDPIQSVTFVDTTKITVLIGASFENTNELKLMKDYISPICYSALSHQMTLGMFGQVSLFCGHFAVTVQKSDILLVRKRTYNYLNNCAEIHTWNGTDFNIIFQGNNVPHIITAFNYDYRFINNKVYNMPLSQMTEQWQTSALTTFKYLLGINFAAGRSFSDYSQYFVFPWVISNYSDVIPDISNQNDVRDLQKPMGMIGEERAKNFLKNRLEKKTEYIIPSHYSMSSAIHHFLLRCPPHTLIEWDVNNGWEVSTKTFHDMGVSWRNASELQPNDCKELIPEFFCLPEMFVNRSKLNTKDVMLPKWCQSGPCQFVMANREVLNNSEKINLWIDLIFGYLQNGSQAEHIGNIYDPICYPHKISSSDDKSIVELQISTLGQCPQQIFRKPHPTKIQKNPDDDKEQQRSLLRQKHSSIRPEPNFSQLEESFDGVFCRGKIAVKPQENSVVLHVKKDNSLRCYTTYFNDAVTMSCSEDGNLIVVDDANFVSSVYFLDIVGDFLGVRKVGSKVFEETVRSRIDSTMQIAISFKKNYYVLWHPIRGTTLEKVEMDGIIDIIFIEKYLAFCILMPKRLLVRTYANTVICEMQMQKEATCMIKHNDGVFVGYKSGSIEVVAIDRMRLMPKSMKIFDDPSVVIKKLVRNGTYIFAWTTQDRIISIL